MSRNFTTSYNDGFNHDFTDEDIRRLVSIATSPELGTHACRWVEGGVRCNATVQGLHLPLHMREYHGILSIGYRTIGFLCQWEGCSDTSTFGKEGLMKHIQEKHLPWKCPNCGTVFANQMARNTHYARCPVVN